MTPRPARSARPAAPHRGRRLIALAAAVAVPAMAAPGEWRGFGSVGEEPREVAPMAFETPGESFPGSAFFYLEDLPRLADAPVIEVDPRPDDARLAASGGAGPAARPFHLAGRALDKVRALRCLTMAVYYEAANESADGQRAVAQVVLNRVAHPSYPNSVCGVVFQGSERRTGCQFTFTCDGSLARKPARAAWGRARGVAARALAGAVYAPVGLATHYHATYVLPYWAASLDNVATIGLHTFYRWRGAAGRKAAFSLAYSGDEPVAAPHPRSADPTAGSSPDPVVLAQAYEAARANAAAQAVAFAPPAHGDRQFAAGNLPRAGEVRPAYADSGRWIAEPGGAAPSAQR